MPVSDELVVVDEWLISLRAAADLSDSEADNLRVSVKAALVVGVDVIATSLRLAPEAMLDVESS